MILWLFCENVTKQNVVDECEMYSKVKDMTYELLCVLFHGFQALVARLSKMKVLCLCLALWEEMSSLTS